MQSNISPELYHLKTRLEKLLTECARNHLLPTSPQWQEAELLHEEIEKKGLMVTRWDEHPDPHGDHIEDVTVRIEPSPFVADLFQHYATLLQEDTQNREARKIEKKLHAMGYRVASILKKDLLRDYYSKILWGRILAQHFRAIEQRIIFLVYEAIIVAQCEITVRTPHQPLARFTIPQEELDLAYRELVNADRIPIKQKSPS